MLENQTAPMFTQKFTKDQFLATEIFSPSLEHNLLVFFGEPVFQAASLFHSRENVMTKARRQVVNVVTSDRDVRVLTILPTRDVPNIRVSDPNIRVGDPKIRVSVPNIRVTDPNIRVSVDEKF